MNDPTSDPIDRDVLARLDFGDPPGEVLGLLLATFLDHSPSLAATIVDAGGRGDAPAVELAAHSLKSSARQYGALHLGELCEALESEARAGRIDAGAVAAAAAEYERARAVLTEVAAGLA